MKNYYFSIMVKVELLFCTVAEGKKNLNDHQSYII